MSTVSKAKEVKSISITGAEITGEGTHIWESRIPRGYLRIAGVLRIKHSSLRKSKFWNDSLRRRLPKIEQIGTGTHPRSRDLRKPRRAGQKSLGDGIPRSQNLRETLS
jgi:hypothetical protein